MLRLRQLSRFRAAAMHLGVSAAIAAAAVALMLFVWYPQPLFNAMGGKLLVVLIVGVDVAIGPLITLIIFDPRKKELAFDLSVIAVLQLSALAYGVYAMHAGRPVFIAFVDDRFAVVSASSLEDEAIAQASPEFRSLPQFGPRLVAVDMPSDINERNEIVFASLGGMGAQHRPTYYVPYTETVKNVLSASQPLDNLHVGEEHRQELEQALAKLRGAFWPCSIIKPQNGGLDANPR
jgi:hypothetical protein